MEHRVHFIFFFLFIIVSSAFSGPARAFEWVSIPGGESRLDFGHTPLRPAAWERADPSRHDYAERVRTETGHVLFEKSSSPRLAFREQDRLDFSRWLEGSWLAASGGDLSSLSMKTSTAREGPMLYAAVPWGGRTCLAFRINSGRKTMVNLGYPATEALLTGIHCRALTPAEATDAERVLLGEIRDIEVRS